MNDKLKTWAPWDSIEESAQEQLQKDRGAAAWRSCPTSTSACSSSVRA